MQLSTATCILGLLLLTWPANALFDQLFPQLPIDEEGNEFGNFLNPSGFDTSRILQCSDDPDEGFNVDLVPESSRPGAPPSQESVDYEFWLPEISRFPYPDSLRWASQDFAFVNALMSCLQDIDRRVQALNIPDIERSYDSVPARLRPWNTGSFADFDILRELTYSFTNPTRDMLPPICASVRGNLTSQGLDLIDDGAFITDDLIIREFENTTGLIFSPDMVNTNEDDRQNFINILESIRCRVVNAWRDLGPTYLPRYVVAGRCFNRGCGWPVRFGQMCRPDLREINFRRLNALRWDCCWELSDDPPTVDSTHTFTCGWRKVNIPILCDCDCSCPRPAKPI